MLPMRLFRSPAFAAGNAASLLLFGALFSAVFFMAQFLQTALGQSPLHAGLSLIPWTGTVFIVAPIAGSMVERVGERPLVVGGLLMQAIGLGWVALVARTDLPYAEMIPPLILAGVGISTAIPAAQNAVVSSVAPSEIGKASGSFSMMRQLGGAFGLAIGVAVFTRRRQLCVTGGVHRRVRSGAGGVGSALAGGRPRRAVTAPGAARRRRRGR